MTKKSNATSWPKNLSADQRIDLAIKALLEIGNNLTRSLLTRETNFYLRESQLIKSQIQKSVAAHTYNHLISITYDYEVLKLCAILDNPSADRNSLPTVACLINDHSVIANLSTIDIHIKRKLLQSIKIIEKICRNKKHQRVQNTLHQWIAHHLNDETKVNRLNPALRYGDETFLLRASLVIVKNLEIYVRKTDFDWVHSMKLAKERTAAFWEGVTVKVRK
ncbi:MAG: hypothetical protein IOC52_10340 [Methylobacterium sp.]|nr:hypothetical protein [Methylobacterium sp.]